MSIALRKPLGNSPRHSEPKLHRVECFSIRQKQMFLAGLIGTKRSRLRTRV